MRESLRCMSLLGTSAALATPVVTFGSQPNEAMLVHQLMSCTYRTEVACNLAFNRLQKLSSCAREYVMASDAHGEGFDEEMYMQYRCWETNQDGGLLACDALTGSCGGSSSSRVRAPASVTCSFACSSFVPFHWPERSCTVDLEVRSNTRFELCDIGRMCRNLAGPACPSDIIGTAVNGWVANLEAGGAGPKVVVAFLLVLSGLSLCLLGRMGLQRRAATAHAYTEMQAVVESRADFGPASSTIGAAARHVWQERGGPQDEFSEERVNERLGGFQEVAARMRRPASGRRVSPVAYSRITNVEEEAGENQESEPESDWV
eukprot:NODE_13569_length_1158_cov_9.845781.p1 GENE.NODE_13569_length_1158_cov_9.845781~~NODE_13569_length_1158_cov_9.845781.p1  ORF type:complete len:318 (-),score=72.75 NODE_13569_length_1158_cov_9.845781:132-1085(-)